MDDHVTLPPRTPSHICPSCHTLLADPVRITAAQRARLDLRTVGIERRIFETMPFIEQDVRAAIAQFAPPPAPSVPKDDATLDRNLFFWLDK